MEVLVLGSDARQHHQLWLTGSVGASAGVGSSPSHPSAPSLLNKRFISQEVHTNGTTSAWAEAGILTSGAQLHRFPGRDRLLALNNDVTFTLQPEEFLQPIWSRINDAQARCQVSGVRTHSRTSIFPPPDSGMPGAIEGEPLHANEPTWASRSINSLWKRLVSSAQSGELTATAPQRTRSRGSTQAAR